MSSPIAFIRSDFDDFGFTPVEFRVVAHVLRRGGESACWASMANIADACRIRRNTAFETVRSLEGRNVLKVTRVPGRTNQIQVTDIAQWTPTPFEAPPRLRTRVSKRVGSHPERGTTGVTVEAPPPTPFEAPQRLSHEGNPIKVIPEGNPSRASQVPLIDPLDGKTDSFKASWSEWMKYRQSIKGVKKLQQVSIDRLLREVGTWSDFEFSEAVSKSIRSGWQSLNRPNQSNFRKPQFKVPTHYEEGKL